MVIGVDAGAICETDDRLKVGVYRVTFELLKHLSEIDSVNTYRLYSFAPIPKDTMRQFESNMVNIPLVPSTGYLKLRLPIELSLHPVDMFLGLSQALPHGVSKSIGFVYDLGFLHYPKLYGTQAKKLEEQTDNVIQKSTHIVTISKASKDDIVKAYNVRSSKITVSYPGVSWVFRKNTVKKHHPVPYFLMVGLLKPGKNIHLAIRAFAKFLTRTKKQYDLIIIGGNTGLNLKLQNRIHLLGYVPDREVSKWYNGATALLSLSQTEGFCLPAVEALASGCPVLYAQNGALPEIVGKAGIGVSLKDLTTIVEAMVRFTKETFETIPQAKKYRWDTFASSVISVINRVLKENTK